MCRGMAHDVCELLCIKSVLKDFGIEYTKAMNLHCANKASFQIAQNPIQLTTPNILELIVISLRKS